MSNREPTHLYSQSINMTLPMKAINTYRASLSSFSIGHHSRWRTVWITLKWLLLNASQERLWRIIHVFIPRTWTVFWWKQHKFQAFLLSPKNWKDEVYSHESSSSIKFWLRPCSINYCCFCSDFDWYIEMAHEVKGK